MTMEPEASETLTRPPGLEFSIAVFAYNEEKLIIRCLESIAACCGSAAVVIHVLINGCTDQTESLVRQYAQDHDNVVPIMIQLGDKANAWNHYVHNVAPAAAAHCFIDGDMTIVPGSLEAMARCLADNPRARAAAGLPVGGRSRDAFREKLIRSRELAGNFYVLRGDVVAEFRRRGIRLPMGQFGEDGLVATLVKWNLDPLGQPCDQRIEPCLAGGFGYQSLSPINPSHWRIYRNRKMRYAVRRQQSFLLYPLLFSSGIQAMPNHVVDLYRAKESELRLRWNGWNTVFDYLAIRRIKKKLSGDDRRARADEARYYS